MEPSLIELSHITKLYTSGEQTVCALSIPALNVHTREWVSVVGPSGSGKTTLLHMLGCLDTPTTGTYSLNGHNVSHLSPTQQAHIRNTMIGFVFQKFHLLPALTAAENLALPLHYAGLSHTQITHNVTEMLKRIGLSNRSTHYPHQLSGGQQQRIAIGRALITNPPLLLADEPTGSLDSVAGNTILTFLKELHTEYPITIVLITHDPLVASHGTRTIHIVDGHITQDVKNYSTTTP
jgi:putative ABC transport system ATP-binding protein